MVARVNMNPVNWGNRNPKTVRLKTGFNSGGMKLLTVNMKKAVGHKR